MSRVLSTPASGCDKHWWYLIGSKPQGCLLWLQTKKVDAAHFFCETLIGLKKKSDVAANEMAISTDKNAEEIEKQEV